LSDPVVHITNGVPDLGTGNITTLGMTLVDGANATHGAIADAAVTAGATGSFSAKLRAISRDIGALVTGTVLAAGAAIIGKVGIDQTTDGTTNAVRLLAETTKVIGTVNVAASQTIAISNANVNVQGGAPVTVVASVPTAVANGTTSSRVVAAATTNATSLKATPGQIYNIDLFNTAAYAVFLKIYNKASAPTVGTDTPVWTIPVPAGGGFSKFFPMGKTLGTGFAYAITKLQADSDTTAVIAGDLTGSIDWV
jgi:hypothetical protein